MFIIPQNETGGSAIINILYGISQEHSNMSMKDALKLLALINYELKLS